MPSNVGRAPRPEQFLRGRGGLATRGRDARGTTYIEMTVIVGIILLLASLAMPNLIAIRRSQSHRQFKASLCVLVAKARSTAIESGQTVALIFDQNSRSIKVADKDGQEFGSVSIPEGITLTKASADPKETLNGEWRVPILADGTSAGGGMQFESDHLSFSFIVSQTSAQPKLTEGLMPDLSTERWKAGSYERRL